MTSDQSPVTSNQPTVLLLFDSRGGLTEQLAGAIAEGVRSVDGVALSYRRIDEAQQSELLECDALIIGSPNWSGMTGKLKEWFDYSGDLWESGELEGKPGAAFTAGWSRSGGIEATLLQLVHLLLARSRRGRRTGDHWGARGCCPRGSRRGCALRASGRRLRTPVGLVRSPVR